MQQYPPNLEFCISKVPLFKIFNILYTNIYAAWICETFPPQMLCSCNNIVVSNRLSLIELCTTYKGLACKRMGLKKPMPLMDLSLTVMSLYKHIHIVYSHLILMNNSVACRLASLVNLQ